MPVPYNIQYGSSRASAGALSIAPKHGEGEGLKVMSLLTLAIASESKLEFRFQEQN
jgi:hypothetical protein